MKVPRLSRQHIAPFGLAVLVVAILVVVAHAVRPVRRFERIPSTPTPISEFRDDTVVVASSSR